MRWGVVTFPGSNDDRDTVHVLERVLGEEVVPLWHKATDLGGAEAVVLPGGFSYGDYLRCGAMARFSPIMDAVRELAASGGPVLGICNGFQILCEAGLLPGALVRNRSLAFVCQPVWVRVERTDTAFTAACREGELLTLPIKHGEGCYVADEATLAALEEKGQVVLRYVDSAGRAVVEANPNGSLGNVAAVANTAGNVVGMMPHPEHAAEKLLGGEDGLKIFRSLPRFLAARAALPEEATASSVVPGP